MYKTCTTVYLLEYLNPHYLLINPQFSPPQSLELGRAHKKASSIVNATIDPDKVILLFSCGYVMNSCISRYFWAILMNSYFSGHLRNSLARSGKLQCKPKTHLFPFNCWRPHALWCEKGSSKGRLVSVIKKPFHMFLKCKSKVLGSLKKLENWDFKPVINFD